MSIIKQGRSQLQSHSNSFAGGMWGVSRRAAVHQRSTAASLLALHNFAGLYVARPGGQLQSRSSSLHAACRMPWAVLLHTIDQLQHFFFVQCISAQVWQQEQAMLIHSQSCRSSSAGGMQNDPDSAAVHK